MNRTPARKQCSQSGCQERRMGHTMYCERHLGLTADSTVTLQPDLGPEPSYACPQCGGRGWKPMKESGIGWMWKCRSCDQYEAPAKLAEQLNRWGLGR